MIKLKLIEDSTNALKKGKSAQRNTLQLCLAEIKNEEIKNKGTALTQDEVFSVLQRLIRQLKETADGFSQRGDKAMEAEIMNRIAIIESYLPSQLSEEELKAEIQTLLQKQSFSGKKDTGKAIKYIKTQLEGKADPKLISTYTAKFLTGSDL